MVYRKEEPHCENEQLLGIRAALANRVGRARDGEFAILNKDARKDLRGHVVAELLTTSDDPIAQIMLGSIMFAHSAQNMLGWFGGYGFQGTQSESSESNQKLQFPNCGGAFSLNRISCDGISSSRDPAKSGGWWASKAWNDESDCLSEHAAGNPESELRY